MSFDPPASAVNAAVALALAEDLLPLGDLTASLLPPDATGKGRFVSREPGVIAGAACVTATFAQLDPTIDVAWTAADGTPVEAGQEIATVSGPLAPLLTGERPALNFIRHLSGIATLTSHFVGIAAEASGGHTRILDTRKTTPGLRSLEKAAVRAGGGFNHRANLSDAIMVKDNHLAGLTIADAVARAKAMWPGRPVHVECDTLDQLAEILETEADRAMVDNFTPDLVRDAVALVGGRLEIEVTGGINLQSVGTYAAARPDFISVGALTHSAGVIDIGLDL